MKNLKLKMTEKTLIITINRPDELNALNSALINELDDVFSNNRDDNNISSVIITGAGSKSFAAGADIKEMANFSSSAAAAYSSRGIELFNNIESYSKPVIAAINGYALGGGLELALSCHIRYISKNSILGLPEVSLGLIPGFGGTQRLRSIVGLGIAIEMITSAKHINSDEALRIGLANKICKDVLEESLLLCQKISLNSPMAIKTAIKSIILGKNANYYDSFDIENNLFSQLFTSSDTKEGIDAFLEKRKPKFKN